MWSGLPRPGSQLCVPPKRKRPVWVRSQLLEQFPFVAFCKFLQRHMVAAAGDAPSLMAMFGLANRLIAILAAGLASFPLPDLKQMTKR